MKHWNLAVNRSVHAPRRFPVLDTHRLDPLAPKPKTTVPHLWVENGVIWQMPNLLVGYTSYSAATTFFSTLKGLYKSPYIAGSSHLFTGTPFSMTDFLILFDSDGAFLVWPSLFAMSSAKAFLSMLPFAPVKAARSHAASAGPVVPTSAMKNFSANSPTGVQTFQAQYIMYAPGGTSNTSAGSGGISYDMAMYSWVTPMGSWDLFSLV